MFTAIYVNNSRLSDVEKLYHLRAKIKSEAGDIVLRSPLTHQGFEAAWSNLKKAYENRRVLVNQKVQKLFTLPTWYL